MRVVIAGGRDITDYQMVVSAVTQSKFDITEVVSGGAPGADSLGERYAQATGIKLTIFKADWDTHGKAAGPIRNREMAHYAQALIAVWGGKSRGTGNMIEQARKLNLPVFVHLV